ncbi:sensor histidine kinase [alpha proteobacterium U9-1i]|nr:sensor histidine kinase [alpha proteobacterium U9-1i]
MAQGIDLQRLKALLPRTGGPLAYVVALLVIGVGILARFPLDAVAQQPLPPFITLYPAIVIAAFAGGLRVGVFAVVVSAASAWWLWIAPNLNGPPSAIQGATTIVYLFTATLTVLTSGGARLLMDQIAASEHSRVLATRESVHRIKNIIAVVQSLSRKIAGNVGSVPEYRDRLEQRLIALAAAQDLLLKRDWDNVDLQTLIESTLAPFLPNPRLEVKRGSRLNVPRTAVTGLSMALYELATNSMKYGALATPQGLVRIEWSEQDGRVSVEWREVGIGRINAGEGAGLGAGLIRAALNSLEDASVRYEMGEQVLACVFDWPNPPDRRTGGG